MKIYAPVADACGTWASVRFVNGVGETNNPNLIEWFRTHGYRLEKCDEMAQKPLEKRDEDILNTVIESMEKETDLDSMTPNELRDYAKAHGFGGAIKNIRNKEKLLEIIWG